MSHKTRLTRLEKIGVGNTLWAFIGIGRPQDAQHQKLLEKQARENYYSSGRDKSAYLAFLPFDCFPICFLGYVKKNDVALMIINKSKNPAETARDSQA